MKPTKTAVAHPAAPGIPQDLVLCGAKMVPSRGIAVERIQKGFGKRLLCFSRLFSCFQTEFFKMSSVRCQGVSWGSPFSGRLVFHCCWWCM